MIYFEIIVLIVTFLAIIISIFTIWLAIMFYRLYSQLALVVTEMSKGLSMSTVRLERLPALLFYKKTFLPNKQEGDNNLQKEKN